ncbi:hypothetical protein LCGC14_0225990 [marine sediment metagenome]|uniref:Xylose isomerase-like TIM barrel domain-containing protein n=1 Tax=marine sediment metagenome TaxID=412755 RepID=A0A0F9WW79_9ZZZZ|nr:sugar phosphate isomerase/epimerase [Phycisphaerae bacterium]HDZ42948.1 sugar phosphate isomerase/epimerase [Phycisphaerae bacterium]
MLAVRTDYLSDTNDPHPHLRRIAEAGFSHVHWGHQSMTDLVYTPVDVERIKRQLDELGLKLLDLHGAVGPTMCWWSSDDAQRQGGVDLVRNRLRMTADLGGGVVIMHVPGGNDQSGWDHLHRSLDELRADVGATGVRIALENGPMDAIGRMLDSFPADAVGMCYDSGHGNLPKADGAAHLDRLKDRLIAVHLHDNDGSGDQHRTPFRGNIDWARLTALIAASSYDKPLSLELALGDDEDEAAFLQTAFTVGAGLTEMVERNRP